VTDDAEITRTEPGPQRRLGLWIGIPVLVVIGLFVVVLATSEPGTDRRVSSFLIGESAPEIAGTTLDGDTFSLLETRGEFVVVNFFATWCTPCRREHPELVAFAEDHARIGDALVVSVLYDDQTSQAQGFFAEFGGDWPVVIDSTGRVALDYGVSGVPESYLVAPDGTVIAKLIGGVTATGLDRILTDATGRGGP
jgi:cytochrome c biogenesis protein CcmG/thiol:disulfide interchange protein DsbE